ncbi:MAG: NADPH-dependent F420 reductase [Flavobacteriales bacterium]
MKIAIIGSGNVGSALAAGFIKAKHEVVFGLRNPDSAKTKKALELIPSANIQNIKDACLQCEIIVISTPADSAVELVAQLGDVSNKKVIDTTNAIRVRPEPYPTAYHAIKELAKTDKIVKCFNSTGFENMINPVYNGNGIDMFCAGNSKEAKELATTLAKEIGFAEC